MANYCSKYITLSLFKCVLEFDSVNCGTILKIGILSQIYFNANCCSTQVKIDGAITGLLQAQNPL